jgi:hypothetical protein
VVIIYIFSKKSGALIPYLWLRKINKKTILNPTLG